MKQPKIGLGPLNQIRPFCVTLDEEFKQSLRDRAKETGNTYRVFFTYPGSPWLAKINGEEHARFKTELAARRWAAFMRGERRSK